MKDLKIILIAFLLGATAFSAVRYVAALKEQKMLKVEVSGLHSEKQNLLQEIEKEKGVNQKLTQKNILLKGNLSAGVKRLEQLFSRYNKAEEDVERLSSQVAILKAENQAVRAEDEKLKQEFMQISQENEALNTRLSSVAELKKAIRELRVKKNPPSVEIKKIEVKKKQITPVSQEGNRGYIIKDGVLFMAAPAAKVKIEVIPASKD